jgi:hypothetical protein
MARIEQRLASLGLTLPPPMQSLPDVGLPFPGYGYSATAFTYRATAHALPMARWRGHLAGSAPM